MAEKVAGRSKSTHESSTLRYGSFGTTTYTESSQRWSFRRSETQNVNFNGEDDVLEQSCDLVTLTEPETVAKSVSLNFDVLNQDFTVKSDDAGFKTAMPFISVSDAVPQNISTVTSWISLGSALWLSADGVDSGNLTVSVSAHITGANKQKLWIRGYGRQIIDNYILEGASSSVQVPQILAGASGSWCNGEAIEQVAFSPRIRNLSNGTLLAVRHASGTSIFQPLLKKGASDDPTSLIDTNILVTIQISSTGGHIHSDVVFAPHDQHIFAVIDIRGNWSSWKLNGRRSRSARIVYKATLLASGKLFSWEERPRPADIEMYFDGWHTALWIPADDEKDADLLVCNRREARVIKVENGTSVALDLRLDSNKLHADILDVKSGPKPRTCLILTTQSVLLYDFSQEDWRNRQQPALVCAWQHGRNTHDATLKLAILETMTGQKLALYSSHSALVTYFNLRLSSDDTVTNLSSSLSVDFSIPKLSSKATSSIIFARCETSNRVIQDAAVHDLYQVIIQYDDLTISTALLSVEPKGRPSARQPTFTLSLPPNRSLAHHSERYIDASEDEADISGWIVHSDHDSEPESSSDMQSDSKIEKEVQPLLTKPFEAVSELIDRSESKSNRHSNVSLLEVLRQLAIRLEGQDSAEMSNGSCLLIDAAGSDWHIDDIDSSASAIHEVTAHDVDQNGNWCHIKAVSSETSLQMPDLYERLFTLYISCLPLLIPSKARIKRERNLREACLELSMSALMRSQEPVMPNPIVLEKSQSTSQVLSDPILPPEDEGHEISRPTTSASQPEYRKSIILQKPAMKEPKYLEASLRGALSRLAIFTEIEQGSLIKDSIAEPADQEIISLLDHIPTDLVADPADYDWQIHEISAAARKSGFMGLGSTTTTTKREKLARAKKRAESILPNTLPLISSAEVTGNTAALPIRSWTDAVDRSNDVYRSVGSQPIADVTMSDGILPQESFSQIEQMAEKISATQPVRGSHAGRVDMGAKGRAKKKRRAGF